MNTKSLILALTVLGLSSGITLAQETQGNTPEIRVITESTPPTKDAIEVGNKICPVSGEKVPVPGEKGPMGDKPVRIEYKGKIYNFCCPMCIKDFKKNPEKYSAIADKEVSANK